MSKVQAFFSNNIRIGGEDAALEALWKNLPDTVAEARNVPCVVDGSGSILCPVGTGSVAALPGFCCQGAMLPHRLLSLSCGVKIYSAWNI